MGRRYFHKGLDVTWKGRTYTLSLQIDDGWQLIDKRSGRVEFLCHEQLLVEYANKVLVLPYDKGEERLKKTDKGEFILATLNTLPEDIREAIKCRRTFIEDYLRNYGRTTSREYVQDGIDKLWKESFGPKPHPATVSKWMKAYLDSGKNALVLAPAHHRKGNRKSRLSPEVEEFCETAIHEVYMRLERGSLKETHERAMYLVSIENKHRPAESRFEMPSRSAIKLMILKIPAFDRYAARFGRLAAQHRFRFTIGHAPSDKPLSHLEVDHTQMDVIVVDEETGLPIGRPWLTLCISRQAKCIMGFNLSFDPPSHATVASALRFSIMPKLSLKEEYPDTKGSWSMYGVPDHLVVDNGLEFHSEALEAACLELGITINYCPRKQPWFKGTIERAIGTLNRGVTAGIRGKTFHSTRERGDYNSVNSASVSLETLRACIVKWIVDIYHERKHSSLDMSPREMWERHTQSEDLALPHDPDLLDAVTGQISRRKVWHYGIELNSIVYNSHELALIRQKIGDPCEVEVRWSTEDLGHIFVMAPDGQVIKVDAIPSKFAYASGRSLFHHKLCQNYVSKMGGDYADPEALAIASQEIKQLIADDEKKNKKKMKVRKQRFKDGANDVAIKPEPDEKPKPVEIKAQAEPQEKFTVVVPKPVFKPLIVSRPGTLE